MPVGPFFGAFRSQNPYVRPYKIAPSAGTTNNLLICMVDGTGIELVNFGAPYLGFSRCQSRRPTRPLPGGSLNRKSEQQAQKKA